MKTRNKNHSTHINNEIIYDYNAIDNIYRIQAEIYGIPYDVFVSGYASFSKETTNKYISELEAGQKTAYHNIFKLSSLIDRIKQLLIKAQQHNLTEDEFAELVINGVKDKREWRTKSYTELINTATQTLNDQIEITKLIIANLFHAYKLALTLLNKITNQDNSKEYNEVESAYLRAIQAPQIYRYTPFEQKIYDLCKMPIKDLANTYLNDVSFSELVIIKSNYDNADVIPINLYNVFTGIKDIKNVLHTPFYNDCVNFINIDILTRSKNLVLRQQSVSFDTNVASYIRSYLQGNTSHLPTSVLQTINACLSIMNHGNISFDYQPYILENLLSTSPNEAKICDTIFYMEKYFYSRQGLTDNECFEKARDLYLQLKESALIIFKNIYDSVYLNILVICYIHLKHSKKSLESKLNLLCEIFDNEICNFPIAELELAYDFYKNPSALKFFNGIQFNTKNILSIIKNMAWDIFHLKMLIINFSFNDETSDLLVPLFCSYDNNLIKEILPYFKLDAIAICKRTKEIFPLYHKHSLRDRFEKTYLSLEAKINRKTKIKNINILNLIEQFENKIINLQNNVPI